MNGAIVAFVEGALNSPWGLLALAAFEDDPLGGVLLGLEPPPIPETGAADRGLHGCDARPTTSGLTRRPAPFAARGF